MALTGQDTEQRFREGWGGDGADERALLLL